MIYLLPHTITNAAKLFPEREAFRYGNISLTYRQMEKRMNQLAGILHTLDIKKGDRVGIYLNRSIETAIAIYGILQAGAVYVPIDPKSPVTRSRFLIEDCGIEILITQPALKRNVEEITKLGNSIHTVIGLEAFGEAQTISWEEVYDFSEKFTLSFRVLEQDVAYIIYTSGSTGQPKGIMHTHYSGLSYARLTAKVYNLTEEDRIGNHAPIHFDISTLGYFSSPLVGACTVIASDAHTIFPTSLAQFIEQEALTVWYSVPLALIQMLQSGVLDNKSMTTLRWVLYAGEAFPPKYLRALMKRWPDARYSNVYGPTETNQCTYYNLPGIPVGDEPIPIGIVWGNTDYLVIDEEGREVTQGEIGELLIRSATQMKGYWGNKKLTERSLYTITTSNGDELLFYRTGDLVKEGTDGVLHFFGRKDFQVKIRGHRVELGAIETCLMAHEGVKEAVVYTVQISEEMLRIEAVVILNLEMISLVSIDILTQFLKTKLPLYAVPEKIRIVENFPRTTSGKVNRKAIEANFETKH